jgi:hypothetical protein
LCPLSHELEKGPEGPLVSAGKRVNNPEFSLYDLTILKIFADKPGTIAFQCRRIDE